MVVCGGGLTRIAAAPDSLCDGDAHGRARGRERRRRDGPVRFVAHDATPKERIFRGRLAAVVKVQICRYTILALRPERRWPGVYAFSKEPAAAVADVPALTGTDGQRTLSGQAGGRG